VYDLSTALELDWYENIGLCKPGEAEKLLRDGDTTLGGRIPVNPSGGLACFGEAVPAQAIAQVCELTWQLRGQAGGGRQVEGATASAANRTRARTCWLAAGAARARARHHDRPPVRLVAAGGALRRAGRDERA
jgi:acetyl-CoA acetyltransferase